MVARGTVMKLPMTRTNASRAASMSRFIGRAVSLFLHSRSRHGLGALRKKGAMKPRCTAFHVLYEAHHDFRRVTCYRDLLLRWPIYCRGMVVGVRKEKHL